MQRIQKRIKKNAKPTVKRSYPKTLAIGRKNMQLLTKRKSKQEV